MFTAFITVFRKWREERRAIGALAKLSDARLTDIGLTRDGVERAVRFGIRT